MPYIPAADREKLDGAIDALAERVVAASKQNDHEAAFAGLLNYACTRLALRVVRLRFGRIRYWIIAAVTGALGNAADEFYRRVGAPYEDRQIAANGDVDLYAAYAREIAEGGGPSGDVV
jgi:hypothetical protein